MGLCLSKKEPDLIVAPIIDDDEEDYKPRRKLGSIKVKKEFASTKTLQISKKKITDDDDASDDESTTYEDYGYIAQSPIEEEKDKLYFYEIVYNRKWDMADNLLFGKRYRHHADYLDHYNRTCLHWACLKSAPINFVKNLIDAHSEATLMQDIYGKTPLHLTCEHSCSNDDLVSLLLAASPPKTTTYQDENGRTPLVHALVSNLSTSLIENIILRNPKQVTIADKDGNLPIVIFFKKYLGTILECLSEEDFHLEGEDKHNMKDILKVVGLFLQAESENSVSSGKIVNRQTNNKNKTTAEWNLLEAAIKSPYCPHPFVQLVLQVYPEKAEQANNYGDLPIHVAAALEPSTLSKSERVYKCDGCRKIQVDCCEKKLYFRNHCNHFHRQVLCSDCMLEAHILNYKKFQSVNKSKETINALLGINADFANMRNKSGALPIILGIKSGKDWESEGLQEIVDAYPEALNMRCNETGLFPFMTAATLVPASEDSRTTVITGRLRDMKLFNNIFCLMARDPRCVEIIEKKSKSGGLIIDNIPVEDAETIIKYENDRNLIENLPDDVQDEGHAADITKQVMAQEEETAIIESVKPLPQSLTDNVDEKMSTELDDIEEENPTDILNEADIDVESELKSSEHIGDEGCMCILLDDEKDMKENKGTIEEKSRDISSEGLQTSQEVCMPVTDDDENLASKCFTAQLEGTDYSRVNRSGLTYVDTNAVKVDDEKQDTPSLFLEKKAKELARTLSTSQGISSIVQLGYAAFS